MDQITVDKRFDEYLKWRCVLEQPYVEFDLGHSGLTDADFEANADRMLAAFQAMERLEAGATSNPDEGRMVGHYWLRTPGISPDEEISNAIGHTVRNIEKFRDAVHSGAVKPPKAERFRRVLLIGIGGSALGPMLLSDCFSSPDRPMTVTVMDNTDPAGIDRQLDAMGDLSDVLFLVISKSGTTPEPRNVMLELQHVCHTQGLHLGSQAVAVTGKGSTLYELSERDKWLRHFPMWDWVGGRTSLFSAVGLVPAALMGIDIRALLDGAARMDVATREMDLRANPAMMMALMWHSQGQGRGDRHAVVLPYKDSLLLLSRYLQQLVMESLGKEVDRQGKPVFQGLSVFGNKGSTDQHAFVQQLRDGRHDFFAMFVRVLKDRNQESIEVEEGVTTGDYLHGFWLGTRAALAERGRASATLTVEEVTEKSLGAIIALFERAVGFYAEMIDVNAYNQPGVEAGKKAAGKVLDLQGRIWAQLDENGQTVFEIAEALDAEVETSWQILQHLLATRAEVRSDGAASPSETRFSRRDS